MCSNENQISTPADRGTFYCHFSVYRQTKNTSILATASVILHENRIVKGEEQRGDWGCMDRPGFGGVGPALQESPGALSWNCWDSTATVRTSRPHLQQAQARASVVACGECWTSKRNATVVSECGRRPWEGERGRQASGSHQLEFVSVGLSLVEVGLSWTVVLVPPNLGGG